MLPLTEGSLRLRADDEDSLTSEDSFFSATEVTGGRDQAWGGVKAGPPLQAHWASTGSWETGGIFSDRSRIWTLSRASSKLLGMGGAEKSGAIVLWVRAGVLSRRAPAYASLSLLQTAVPIDWPQSPAMGTWIRHCVLPWDQRTCACVL